MGEEESPQPPKDIEEIKTLSIEELPANLGFVESKSMEEVKERLVGALTNRDDQHALKHLSILYLSFGEKIVDDSPGEANRTKLQIGLSLAKILARKSAIVTLSEILGDSVVFVSDHYIRKQELLREYIEDLEEIWQTTNTPGLQYLTSVISQEIDWATAQLDTQ